MTETRAPMANEVKLVVLVDDIQYHSWIPMDQLDAYLAAMERRLDNGEALRDDQIGQMSLRQWTAGKLRDRSNGQAVFNDVGGAICLWLALRHYEGGAQLRRGVDSMAGAGCVLTVSIGSSPGAAEDTAWSFTVGAAIYDGREKLSTHDCGKVTMFGSAVDRPLA